jgi:hypothetical protein
MTFIIALLISIQATVNGLLIGIFFGLYIAYIYEKETGEPLFDIKDREEGEN